MALIRRCGRRWMKIPVVVSPFPDSVEEDEDALPNGDWKCKTCGNVNWKTSKICNLCRNPRKQDQSKNAATDDNSNKGEGSGREERLSDDDMYDAFGRKKKRYRYGHQTPIHTATSEKAYSRSRSRSDSYSSRSPSPRHSHSRSRSTSHRDSHRDSYRDSHRDSHRDSRSRSRSYSRKHSHSTSRNYSRSHRGYRSCVCTKQNNNHASLSPPRRRAPPRSCRRSGSTSSLRPSARGSPTSTRSFRLKGRSHGSATSWTTPTPHPPLTPPPFRSSSPPSPRHAVLRLTHAHHRHSRSGPSPRCPSPCC